MHSTTWRRCARIAVLILKGAPSVLIACAGGWQATGSTLNTLRSIVHALRGWPTPMAATINSTHSPFAADGSLVMGRRATSSGSLPSRSCSLRSCVRCMTPRAACRGICLASQDRENRGVPGWIYELLIMLRSSRGGARGIGAQIVESLADEGARVAIWDRDPQPAQELAAKIVARGGRARAFSGDVTARSDVERVFSEILAAWSSVQVLVNNAGLSLDAALADMTDEQWDTVNQVCLKGSFMTCRAAANSMIDNPVRPHHQHRLACACW